MDSASVAPAGLVLAVICPTLSVEMPIVVHKETVDWSWTVLVTRQSCVTVMRGSKGRGVTSTAV